MKVEDEFRRRYHDVDALVFGPLWDTWRHLAGTPTADLELALDRLQAKAEADTFGTRRSGFPPPPAAVPHLVPPAR
jgi:hypothetical protein